MKALVQDRARKRLFRRSIVAALFAVFLASQVGAVDKVKVAYLPALSFSPLFVAIEKGFLKEQGIEVDMLDMGGGQQMMLALASGEIQVASAAATAGFYNLIAKATDLRIVADKGQVSKQENFSPVVVRKELYDSGEVRTPQDLMKLKIAQFNKASISEFVLWKLIEPYGKRYQDLNLVYLFPPQQYTALKTGAIQVAVTVEPWGSRMEAEGFGKILERGTSWLTRPVFQIAVIMYSGKFIGSSPQVAQRWMNAYVRGLKFHNEKGYGDADVQMAVSKWTKVAPDVIGKAIPTVFSKDGRVDVPSLDEQQRWFLAMGYLKELLPTEKWVDMSFVEKAQ